MPVVGALLLFVKGGKTLDQRGGEKLDHSWMAGGFDLVDRQGGAGAEAGAEGTPADRGDMAGGVIGGQPGVFHGFPPTLSFRCYYTVLGRLLSLATPTPSPLDEQVS